MMRQTLLFLVALCMVPACDGLGSPDEGAADAPGCEAPTETGHLVPSTVNPNGDSPLALAMRAMRDDVKSWRAKIIDGSLAAGAVRDRVAKHREILVATPTDPKTRDTFFNDMAQSYVAQIDALAAKPDAEHYNSAVAVCQGCHNRTCRGPLVVIDRLPIPQL